MRSEAMQAVMKAGLQPPGPKRMWMKGEWRDIQLMGWEVTAEPLPTRLASIARGTGEVDAVYHIAYDALDVSVARNANADQQDAWREVVGQRRLLSYELLADTLASW